MRRSRFAVAGVVLALLASALLYYFYGGSVVPQGQQPLVSLNPSNLPSTLEDTFNQSAKSVRLLVMLSPT